MNKYITKKSDMKFPNIEALNTVTSVLKEVDEAIKDKSRTIKTSSIPEALAGAIGVGIGAGIGFGALYLGGTVVGVSAAGITSGLAAAGALIGGGMVAGLAVIAAPAVILGTAGVAITTNLKNKQLKHSKELCYTEALKKQNDIIELLASEKNEDKERIEYLNSINILLQAAINDLKHDLGKES